jgi:hypothetical protein
VKIGIVAYNEYVEVADTFVALADYRGQVTASNLRSWSGQMHTWSSLNVLSRPVLYSIHLSLGRNGL